MIFKICGKGIVIDSTIQIFECDKCDIAIIARFNLVFLLGLQYNVYLLFCLKRVYMLR